MKDVRHNDITQSFIGKGKLTIGDRVKVDVHFDVAQYIDSSIIACCNVLTQIAFTPEFLHQPVTLEGCTDQSMSVIMPNAQIRQMSSAGSVTEHPEHRLILEGRLLNVGTLACASPATVHFHITNLEFGGTTFIFAESKNGLDSQRQSLHCLPFTINGIETNLQWTFDHMENVHLARVKDCLAVTAELSFGMTRADELAASVELADNICLLLSLARGCRIAAVNTEIKNSSGTMLYFTGHRVPKKRFGLHNPKDLDPHWPLGTQRFVEHAYPYIALAKEQWAFDKAVELYLDAKRQGDEFELWGLKMVICMEFLYSKYVALIGEQSIMKPGQFTNKVQRIIKEHLKTAISESVEGVTQDQICAMLKKIKELNRPSFRDSLIELNKKVNARISDAAVQRFVTIRNSLVHRGTYSNGDKYGSSANQYDFLDDYVRRFLLALVGNPLEAVYKGYTWSDGKSVSESYAQDLF